MYQFLKSNNFLPGQIFDLWSYKEKNSRGIPEAQVFLWVATSHRSLHVSNLARQERATQKAHQFPQTPLWRKSLLQTPGKIVSPICVLY